MSTQDQSSSGATFLLDLNSNSSNQSSSRTGKYLSNGHTAGGGATSGLKQHHHSSKQWQSMLLEVCIKADVLIKWPAKFVCYAPGWTLPPSVTITSVQSPPPSLAGAQSTSPVGAAETTSATHNDSSIPVDPQQDQSSSSTSKRQKKRSAASAATLESLEHAPAKRRNPKVNPTRGLLTSSADAFHSEVQSTSSTTKDNGSPQSYNPNGNINQHDSSLSPHIKGAPWSENSDVYGNVLGSFSNSNNANDIYATATTNNTVFAGNSELWDIRDVTAKVSCRHGGSRSGKQHRMSTGSISNTGAGVPTKAERKEMYTTAISGSVNLPGADSLTVRSGLFNRGRGFHQRSKRRAGGTAATEARKQPETNSTLSIITSGGADIQVGQKQGESVQQSRFFEPITTPITPVSSIAGATSQTITTSAGGAGDLSADYNSLKAFTDACQEADGGEPTSNVPVSSTTSGAGLIWGSQQQQQPQFMSLSYNTPSAAPVGANVMAISPISTGDHLENDDSEPIGGKAKNRPPYAPMITEPLSSPECDDNPVNSAVNQLNAPGISRKHSSGFLVGCPNTPGGGVLFNSSLQQPPLPASQQQQHHQPATQPVPTATSSLSTSTTAGDSSSMLDQVVRPDIIGSETNHVSLLLPKLVPNDDEDSSKDMLMEQASQLQDSCVSGTAMQGSSWLNIYSNLNNPSPPSFSDPGHGQIPTVLHDTTSSGIFAVQHMAYGGLSAIPGEQSEESNTAIPHGTADSSVIASLLGANGPRVQQHNGYTPYRADITGEQLNSYSRLSSLMSGAGAAVANTNNLQSHHQQGKEHHHTYTSGSIHDALVDSNNEYLAQRTVSGQPGQSNIDPESGAKTQQGYFSSMAAANHSNNTNTINNTAATTDMTGGLPQELPDAFMQQDDDDDDVPVGGTAVSTAGNIAVKSMDSCGVSMTPFSDGGPHSGVLSGGGGSQHGGGMPSVGSVGGMGGLDESSTTLLSPPPSTENNNGGGTSTAGDLKPAVSQFHSTHETAASGVGNNVNVVSGASAVVSSTAASFGSPFVPSSTKAHQLQQLHQSAPLSPGSNLHYYSFIYPTPPELDPARDVVPRAVLEAQTISYYDSLTSSEFSIVDNSSQVVTTRFAPFKCQQINCIRCLELSNRSSGGLHDNALIKSTIGSWAMEVVMPQCESMQFEADVNRSALSNDPNNATYRLKYTPGLSNTRKVGGGSFFSPSSSNGVQSQRAITSSGGHIMEQAKHRQHSSSLLITREPGLTGHQQPGHPPFTVESTGSDVKHSLVPRRESGHDSSVYKSIPTFSADVSASLLLTVLFGDTFINHFTDVSFDACPLCACNMDLVGWERGLYVPSNEGNSPLCSPATGVTPGGSASGPLSSSDRMTSVFGGTRRTRRSGKNRKTKDGGSNASTSGLAVMGGGFGTRNCNCGYSASRARLLSTNAGLFYEDEQQCTGGQWRGPKQQYSKFLTKYDDASQTDGSSRPDSKQKLAGPVSRVTNPMMDLVRIKSSCIFGSMAPVSQLMIKDTSSSGASSSTKSSITVTYFISASSLAAQKSYNSSIKPGVPNKLFRLRRKRGPKFKQQFPGVTGKDIVDCIIDSDPLLQDFQYYCRVGLEEVVGDMKQSLTSPKKELMFSDLGVRRGNHNTSSSSSTQVSSALSLDISDAAVSTTGPKTGAGRKWSSLATLNPFRDSHSSNNNKNRSSSKLHDNLNMSQTFATCPLYGVFGATRLSLVSGACQRDAVTSSFSTFPLMAVNSTQQDCDFETPTTSSSSSDPVMPLSPPQHSLEPSCDAEVVGLLKNLLPCLRGALQKSRGTWDSNNNIVGPITWRHFFNKVAATQQPPSTMPNAITGSGPTPSTAATTNSSGTADGAGLDSATGSQSTDGGTTSQQFSLTCEPEPIPPVIINAVYTDWAASSSNASSATGSFPRWDSPQHLAASHAGSQFSPLSSSSHHSPHYHHHPHGTHSGFTYTSATSTVPYALRFWDRALMEPFAGARDVIYLVISPDNHNNTLISNVRYFFKELSETYESMCRFGRHIPINKILADGIMRVNSTVAQKFSASNSSNNTPHSTIPPDNFLSAADFGGDDDSQFLSDNDPLTLSRLRIYALACKKIIALYLSSVDPHSPSSYRKDATGAGSQAGNTSNPFMSPPEAAVAESQLGGTGFGMQYGAGNAQGNGANHPFPANGAMMTGQGANFGDKLSSSAPGSSSVAMCYQPNFNINSDCSTPLNSPVIVIYIIDPWSADTDSPAASWGLNRCYLEMLLEIPHHLRAHIQLQIIPLEQVQSYHHQSSMSEMRSIALSVYAQARTLTLNNLLYRTKSLTGFGPTGARDVLSSVRDAPVMITGVWSPPCVIHSNHNDAVSPNAMISTREKDSVLLVTYCLSETQDYLLVSATDQHGQISDTTIINIRLPQRHRRKHESVVCESLAKLWAYILSIISLSCKPWRLVVGRFGRLGHSELKAWSVYLNKKGLHREGPSAQLRDRCPQCADLAILTDNPCILSACLISLEPETAVRAFLNPALLDDPRVGSAGLQANASKTGLSTYATTAGLFAYVGARGSDLKSSNNINSSATGSVYQDTSITHILVFSTSAHAQMVLQGGGVGATNPSESDTFLFDVGGIDDELLMNFGDTEGEEGSNIFQQPDFGGSIMSDVHADEECNIQNQPLALGYFISTAPFGPVPGWFLHGQQRHKRRACPSHLKFNLHIHTNCVELQQTTDELLGGGGGQAAHASASASASNPSSATGSGPGGSGGPGGTGAANTSHLRHPLDSSSTTEVLRCVMQTYNALSWLNTDIRTGERRSCFPVHIQNLMRLYHSINTLR